MNYRIPLAGVLAAIAMFVWTGFAHMATPLASAGFSQIPNEAIPAAALQQSIGDKPGLYLFPWAEPGAHDAMKTYEQKTKTMASGWLVYRPPGQSTVMTGATLGWEFLKQVVCCIVAAFLLAETSRLAHYAARVAFVGCIGVVAALTDNISNWAWYGFPGAYTAAQVTIDWLAYVVAGLVLAAMIKPSNTTPPVT